MANLKWSLIDLFVIVLSSLIVTYGAVDAHCSSEERDALLGFKAAITEDSAGFLKSWNTSSDCCSWTGVTCDPATGGVTALRLRGQRGGAQSLKGTLSDSLGRLQYLRNLTIVSMTQLGGPIPKTLSLLTNLTTLVLDNNGFEGAIPQELRRLKSLQVLSLQLNRLTGDMPKGLGALTSLRTLKLGFNNLTEAIPRSFRQLVHLRVLDLRSNLLSGVIPSYIGKFRMLSKLELSDNNFVGSIPTSLCSLPRIVEISLSGNKLTGKIPEQIGNLKSLKSLFLDRNLLSGCIPESVGKLEALEKLDLGSNKFVNPLPRSLAEGLGLSSLRFIILSDNKLNLGTVPSWMLNRKRLSFVALAGSQLVGALPSPAANTGLQDIDLSRNNLTGGLEFFLRGLTGLQSIQLSSNKLEGNISSIQWPRELIRIDLSSNMLQGSVSGLLKKDKANANANATLRSVNLFNNRISGTLPEFNAGSNLRFLNLSANVIGGHIPESIGNLQKLMRLDLSHNHINGLIPPNVGDMASLEFLDVSDNALTASIPETLNKLKAIKHANFARNQLCGDLPKGPFFDKLAPDAYDHKKCKILPFNH